MEFTMYKKLTLILLSLVLSLEAENKALLKLDTKGHTGLVKDIIVTEDGDIITGGNDKTIRVWDSKSGREKRKILGAIATGNEGKVFAIALSHDEKYLAVGGYYKNDAIRIFDYASGKLIKALKGHSNIANDLAFSSDDKYLISGSSDKTARIWDLSNDFALKDTIKFHKNDIYGVKIIKKGYDYYAVSVGYDNKIALYDMQERRIINSDQKPYKLKYLAFSERLQHIAVLGNNKTVLIYDFSLNLLKTIPTNTIPEGLAYSKDDKYLIAGTATSPRHVKVYKAKQDYQLKSTFKKHNNATVAVGFINDHLAVSAGGDNNDIYIWDINSLKVKRKIVGVGNSVWSVGIDGNSIAWSNKGRNVHNDNSWSLQKSINLDKFSILNHKITPSKFNRIATKQGSYSLSHARGGDYNYYDGILNIKKNNTLKHKIIRTSSTGYQHRCYGWYKNFIVSGGANGHIKVYTKTGEVVADLIGHTGDIWSIALDGDRLVSGSYDQTMMVWDLSALDSGETDLKLYPLVTIFVSEDDEWVVWTKSGYFNASVSGDQYVGYHINQGLNKEARYVGSDKYFETLYRPDIVSLTLKLGSEAKAMAYAGRNRKVETVNVTQSLPPVVTLLSKSSLKTTRPSTTISFSIDSDTPIKELIIIQNGKTVKTRGLKKIQNSQNNRQSVEVSLDDGQNYIEIRAKNQFAMSDGVTIDVVKTSKKSDIYKPTLYLLSIGVSVYDNPEYNLGVADKDATAIAKMFKGQKGKIFKDVVVKTLTNKQATSDNILDGLDWIDREATSKDVVMIFIAGHGVNDDRGSYYFLSHDANLKRLRRTAVNWQEIQVTMKSLPSKVILLADTCHSGNITGTRRDITSAIKSITHSGTGSIIMTATTGSGYSYEQKSWGHGAFTKSLLDGIGQYKADYDGDGIVSMKELDLYVTSRVKKLTKGKQKPTTIIPDSIPDFAIGIQ